MLSVTQKGGWAGVAGGRGVASNPSCSRRDPGPLYTWVCWEQGEAVTGNVT